MKRQDTETDKLFRWVAHLDEEGIPTRHYATFNCGDNNCPVKKKKEQKSD